MNAEAKKARDFLRNYRLMVRMVRSSATEYSEASSTAYMVTACAGDGGGGGSHSQQKMEAAAVRMLDHADDIAASTSKMTDAYESRNRVIERTSELNPLWGEVLRSVYVDGLTMAELQRHLERDRSHPYDRSSVYRLHERALEKAYGVMEEMGLA